MNTHVPVTQCENKSWWQQVNPFVPLLPHSQALLSFSRGHRYPELVFVILKPVS